MIEIISFTGLGKFRNSVVVPTKLLFIVLMGIKHFKKFSFLNGIFSLYHFLLFSLSFILFLLSLYFSSVSAFFNLLSFFVFIFYFSLFLLIYSFPSFLYSIFLLFLPIFFNLFLLTFFTSFFSFVVINSILMKLSAVEPHYPNRPRLTKYVKLGQNQDRTMVMNG